MYVCMYACMHACMHVCMYVCMYVCVLISFGFIGPTPQLAFCLGTEKEALLSTIRKVLGCYVEKYPKDKTWKDQLERVTAAMVSDVSL